MIIDLDNKNAYRYVIPHSKILFCYSPIARYHLDLEPIKQVNKSFTLVDFYYYYPGEWYDPIHKDDLQRHSSYQRKINK